MKKIYHRIQVNKDLLSIDNSPTMRQTLSDVLVGSITDTLPKGKLTGVYFLNYIESNPSISKPPITVGGGGVQAMAMPNTVNFLTSHTNIRIEDTRGRLITEPTDIRDYDRKNWNAKGYKEISLDLETNEQITINYETIGDSFPICGEFIFVIEDNSCAC